MIISDRQAELALSYLRQQQTLERVRRATARAAVSPEFLELVKDRIASLPDTRDERIVAAWEVLDGDISSAAVADKMIGRLISDEVG
jgi:hypothetical protein